jgi:CRISPR-associated protein Cas1
MQHRILDISEEAVWLKTSLKRLVLSRMDKPDISLPFSDLAVLVVAHPRVTYTQSVLTGLVQAGGVFVTCDAKRHPTGMLLPLTGHSIQTERFAKQAAASKPTQKRLWQQIVRNKIAGQAEVLKTLTGSDAGLSALIGNVRSGDPTNVEAVSARKYWPALFGPSFRRIQQQQESEFDSDDSSVSDETIRFIQNRWLNYGYAVLRAMTARAICAAGLHPSLGLHHHSRYNAYCLADDLMEPFRPLIDLAVAEHLSDMSADLWDLNRTAKERLLNSLTGRCVLRGERRSIFDVLTRVATSLCSVYCGESTSLEIPETLNATF